jgi:hypothetical protein
MDSPDKDSVILAMRKFLLFVVIAVLTSSTVPVYAGASGGGSRVAKEEIIPAVLIVQKIGQADIEIIYRKNYAYLPIISIFRFLDLHAEYSADRNILNGAYPNSGSPFSVNLNTGEVKVRDTSASLVSTELTFSDEEVYLREDLFRTVFKMAIRYDPRRLAVMLSPSPNLPIFAARDRERIRRRFLERSNLLEPDYFSPRHPSLFEMGKINWTLSNRSSYNASPRTNYDVQAGGKILFGDLDFRIRGIVNTKVQEDNLHGTLRYLFDGDGYLRQITFGDVQPVNAFSRGILGVEVSNRPAARRLTFGTESYLTKLPGSSEFEFYNQGFLSKFFRPPADSIYQISFPLYYGISDYEARTYNQWGDMNSRKFRTVVPQDMVPEHTFQYSLIGGKIRGYDQAYGEASGSYGITRVLTVGTGSELYEKGFAKEQVIPFVTGTARFSSSLVGDLYVSPLAVSHASLDLLLADQERFTLEQYVYANDPTFNLGGLLSTSSFNFNIPFYLNTTDLVFGGAASNTIAQYSHDRSFSGIFGAHFPSLQLFYSYDYLQSASGSAPYEAVLSQSTLEASVLAPSQVVFRGGTTVDHLNSEVRSVHIGVEKVLFRNFFLQLSYQRNFSPSFGMVLLQFNYSLPFVRFSSTTTRLVENGRDYGTVSTNSARGVLFFSTKSGDLMYNSTQQSNRGGILMNTFVDRNGNGNQDGGEESLPATKFFMYSPRTTASPSYTPKGLLITNVEPYQQYTAFLDSRNIFEDPLYVPKYESISITGEPNILKVVNFPVLIGGSIHGVVRMSIPGTKGAPIPVEGTGVILRLKPEANAPKGKPYVKTMKTFSTGELQFTAIPPGTYEISLDPSDLQIYGIRGDVTSKEITVKATPEGDHLEGVDFDLVRQ